MSGVQQKGKASAGTGRGGQPLLASSSVSFSACCLEDDEVCSLTAKNKESEAGRSRLQRMTGVQQAQMEKYKALAEDSGRKSEGLQQEVEALKKVGVWMESM